MSEETKQSNETPRLKQLLQQQEKIKKQIQLEKKRHRDSENRKDTRRKIVDGALIQNYARENPEFLSILQRLRHEKITRQNDRELFNLPPLPKKDEKQ